MLTVNQLSKSYGIEPLFENVSFTVNPGERVALVGPNGCGKTTLLKILIGQEKASSGSIRFSPSDLRIGYLAQGQTYDPAESFGEYIARLSGDLPTLEAELEKIAHALVANPQRVDLQEAYNDTLTRLSLADESAGAAPGILAALGLDQVDADQLVNSLSGGQKTRLAMASMLLSSPQLLLLDEPTNHLDLDMLTWLGNWLRSYPFAVLVVSHDRAFLDSVATSILDMDPVKRAVRSYAGNYSDYLDQKQAERERQWQEYQDQQEEIARLRQSASRVRSQATAHKGGKADPAKTDGFSVGHFMNRAKETISRAKQIEARVDRMMGDDRVDKPGRTWQMKMEFQNIPSSGRDVLVFNDLSIGYGEKVLLANLNGVVRFGQRLALVGPNGAGKTTLLRTIQGQLPPLAGEVRLGANVRIGYMAQEQENLDAKQTALTTLQRIMPQSETGVRALLSKFLFTGDEVFTPVPNLSYGERARLTLACLVAQGCNFLLLDEPINHLDIPSRAQFEQALAVFEGTILAVVHDRYFISQFASRIWEVRDGKIQEIYEMAAAA